MTCPNCGGENPDKNRFCTHCGGKVAAPAGAKAAVRERTPEKPKAAPRPAAQAAPPPSAAAGAPSAPAPAHAVVRTGSALTDFLMSLEWQTVAYALVLLAAVVSRFWDLGGKPLHHDESIHAYYAFNLLGLKGYQYDPTYHGPFLYHANAFAYFVLGASDVTCRVVPALFGVFLVALPFFFREWLGRTGALMAALLITLSPTITYVSRFIRDDIYQETCAFLMVVCFFKWLRTRKRWLIYVASAALAVSFASMEATYITLFTFGTFLFIWYLRDTRLPAGHWPYSICGGIATIVTMCLMAVSWGRHDLKWDFLDGETVFKYAAMAGLLFGLLVLIYRSTTDKRNDFVAQSRRFRANLASNRDFLYFSAFFLFVVLFVVTAMRIKGYSDAFPVALGIALVPTVVIGAMLAAIAFYFEDVELSFWAACVFALIYIPLFSTFFTNPKGLADGVTTSLTYWLLQHGVKRGNQPLNFYPFLTLVYELAPFILSTLAIVFYAMRRNVLAYCLIWWTLLSVGIYNWAGEKMPWLLVHLAVPACILSGYYMGHVLEHLNAFRRWVVVPLFVLLCGYSVHALVPVNYYWPSDPIEPLVYTQSSDDIPRICKQIDRLAYQTTGGKEMHMTILGDATWPFPWYLRDHKFIAYPADNTLQPTSGQTTWSDTPVLISQDNADWPRVRGLLGDRYDVKRYHHRVWWIMDFGKLVPGFVDVHTFKDLLTNLRSAQWHKTEWLKLWKYLMFREIWNEKGSIDLHFCVQKDLEHKFD